MGIKNQNLVDYIGQLNQGQRLIKIGNSYFPVGVAGGGIQQGDLYVAVEVSGTIKAQKLSFDGTSATLIGQPQMLQDIKLFNTSLVQPNIPAESGSSADFYKCISVDTILSTWTGNKAIKNQITKAYSFEETVTSGLTYSIITPITGNVYTDDALVRSILYTGFDPNTIFLLDVNTLTDKTGNFTITKDNLAAVFTTELGRFGQNRLVFPDKGCLLLEAQNGLTIGGNQDYTIQLWYTYLNNNGVESYFPFFGPNQSLTNNESFQFHGGYYGNSIYMWQTNTDTKQWYNSQFEYGSTHHIALSRRASDNNWKCWIDGNVCQDWDYYNGCVNDPMSLLYIGNGYSGQRYNKAAIQDYRISNCIRYTTDTFQVPSSPLN